MQSLLDTVKLRQTGDDSYQSVTQPWAPEDSLLAGIPKEMIDRGARALFGEMKNQPSKAGRNKGQSPPKGLQKGGNVYGGHVLAQSLWAASVYGKFGTGASKGVWTVHSVHAHFLRPGKVALPFDYKVTPLFQGATFCSRTVTVTQTPPGESTAIVFSAVCAFKLPEKQSLSHSAKFDPRFEKILVSRTPEEWPQEDGVDAPWYRNIAGALSDFKEVYQAVEMRLVTPENFPEMPLPEQKTFHFYKPVGSLDLPADITAGRTEDELRALKINLQACAHLYASDRNSLFHISNLHEASAIIKRIASITHVVIFHGDPEDLEWKDSEDGRWFVQEVFSDHSGHGRGVHNSRLWQWGKNGAKKLVGSTIQDGLIRYKEESKI